MDPSTRTLQAIFTRIQTGACWEDCWIWTGGMSGGHPLAVIDGERIRVRSYVRTRVHGLRYGHLLPDCDPRCVHPDHSYTAQQRVQGRTRPYVDNPHLDALAAAAREIYGQGYRSYRLTGAHSPAS